MRLGLVIQLSGPVLGLAVEAPGQAGETARDRRPAGGGDQRPALVEGLVDAAGVVGGGGAAAGSASDRGNDSSKIAISVAQDLSVVGLTPFGSICKLLVALERARSTAGPDRAEEPAPTNRLMGGVAISF